MLPSLLAAVFKIWNVFKKKVLIRGQESRFAGTGGFNIQFQNRSRHRHHTHQRHRRQPLHTIVP